MNMMFAYTLSYHDDLKCHSKAIKHIAQRVDELARQALYDEVSLEYKPGLVCPSSRGGHDDMDFELFIKSIDSLTGYFAEIFILGYQQAAFELLQQCGMRAEQKMLKATQGINTHRGAIFNLGFACASLGGLFAQHKNISINNISQYIINTWQYDLLNKLKRMAESHGQQMQKKYGIHGAIEQVAYGFPTVLTYAIPAYQHALGQNIAKPLVHLQTLFALIAHLADTNIVWRGGIKQLEIVQKMAQQFLSDGGIFQTTAIQQVQDMMQYFEKYHLSAGGSADLLGLSLFLMEIEHEFGNRI